MTQICETVTAERMADLRMARDGAGNADLVELRLDGVVDLDVAGALEGRTKPVIVTCRPRWEGGRFSGSEEERLRLLGDAVQLGAEFVDVEWRADWQSLPRGDRTQLVLSYHDFEGVPADLPALVQAMRGQAGAVIKIAVTATRLADCLKLREAVKDTSPVVALAMGPAGQLTRLCPWLLGSQWTYAGAAAPGQISTRELAETYRVRTASRSTAIYAVAGAPLAHSASPAMQNAAFAAADMDSVYVPLETSSAPELLEVAEAIGLAGASVTAPLKESVLDCGVEGDELVRQIRAVNTLRRTEGRWEARNFDVAAFLAPLARHARRLAGQYAAVLGAGGAARSAIFALKTQGARVKVASRRFGEAERLALEFHVGTTTWPPEPGWDLLVNTTPIGTWPARDESPLPRDRVRGGVVYDLVYNPRETKLLKWAREAGAETIGGLEMLVDQACRQFEWWTGVKPSRAIVEGAALQFLKRDR